MKRVIPLLAVFFLMGVSHPFYMGVCELKYNQNNKALEVSVKLFINDLEDALKKINGKPVDLLQVKDSAQVKKQLEEYIRKRLSLTVNGKALNCRFLGFEKEEEALWMYFESDHCPAPKRIDVDCWLLYDYLPGQMNIFHAETGSSKKSTRLANPERHITIEF